MAGLIITEAYAEAKDKNEPLIMQTLDAEKAFDVVWHDSLLRKLYKDGVRGDLWLLVKSLHTDSHTIVKWHGEHTQPILIEQGIRQGAKLSTLMYKRFNNDLLNQLQNAPEGMKIGNVDVTSPTCADDIALLSQKEKDAQILTNTVHEATKKDRFSINASKCEVVHFKTKKKQCGLPTIKYNNTNIEVVNSAKHLGIERNPNNTPDVDSRIQTARKTVYALLGSGLHGKNGISPIISFHMWSTFVIPRLLHGIELLNIRKSDIDTLERYQRKFLKQIQTLPERTASVAVLTLLGAKTIEAQIDTRIITTFLNIAKDPSTVEFQIAIRQLTVKADNSNSWFIKVKNILHKYDLPCPEFLLKNIRNIKQVEYWKIKCKQGIAEFWNNNTKREVSEKSTLKYLQLQENPSKVPHQVWAGSKHSPFASQKAIVKAKLLTGTLRLQANRAKFNSHEVDPTCKLCKGGPENEQHFVLECPALEEKRKPYKEKTKYTLEQVFSQEQSNEIINSSEKLLQLYLDCTTMFDKHNRKKYNHSVTTFENLGRDLLYTLHCHRAIILRPSST